MLQAALAYVLHRRSARLAKKARVQTGHRQPGDTGQVGNLKRVGRSEEHTSELQSLMRNSYAVFCLKKKKIVNDNHIGHDDKYSKEKQHKEHMNTQKQERSTRTTT